MPDDLLARVRDRRDQLPRAERGIADLVLADPGAAATRTITELARAAGTSEATVHRFCRSLELRGYAQLRLGLAAEAERLRADTRPDLGLGTDLGPDDTPEQLVRKVGWANARAAEETAAALDPAVLAALGDRVRRARRILAVGVGSSALAALDATQKLQRLGYPAVFASDVHAALMTAALLGPDDLALGISHSGRAREVVEVLEEARLAGAATAVVTSNPRSPAAAPADLVLRTAARETEFRSGGTASRTAQLTVVDALYVTLAQHDHARILDGLERAHDAIRRHSLRRPR
ncbi:MULTISPECIES: MurR/RpiR family transcriptional regulator [Kitasatospora]|uniref:Putative RpiR family transcriptional regulator n=1 Tax=Kitasatospora setae (strain ATCC 33774 / DSM 43861 / JCM 3304 / KCC A-0304 / NBRC 14216 / KM-6054) TaxID=452652 RepID=E4NFK7_KITSK|nr:MurR/RpiR family transcriptional regulator [Kitasatospora setae]BAJ30287.1 putative RpiR family transcriptional regulator [Kitasatospora setae KM-6054]